MVTIREIARACGVSAATVSNIMNDRGKTSEETKRKVLAYAEKVHYSPNAVARSLKMKSSRSIGVIVEDMTIFSIPDIVDGITDYCDRRDYKILLSNLRLFKRFYDTYYNQDFYFDQVRNAIRTLMNYKVDGIIYVTAHERNLDCLPEDLEIPMVMAYGYTHSSRIPSVVVDDVDGAYQIMSELIRSGHTNIGVVSGKADSLHTQARLMGIQKALYDAHLPFLLDHVKVGNWERQSGYDAVDDLLRQGVTAICCMNDLMAGGVYDRLYEKGLTAGRDLSVTGYDDRQTSAYYHPALSTVKLPLHNIGYASAVVLLEMLGEDSSGAKENDTAPEFPETTGRKTSGPQENTLIRSRWKKTTGHKDDIVYSIPCELVLRDSIADIRSGLQEKADLPLHID